MSAGPRRPDHGRSAADTDAPNSFARRSTRAAASRLGIDVCIVCLVTCVMRASSEVESSGLVSNTLRIPYSCSHSPRPSARMAGAN